MQTTKKALVIGGTGLVGSHLTRLLCESETYTEVVFLTRRPVEPLHPKVKVVLTDFRDLLGEAHLFDVQDVFCCIGSTKKKTGNAGEYRRIDVEIPVAAAKAAQFYAEKFFFVSSIGANPGAMSLYLRMKGEAEKKILGATLPCIVILRPSVLLGQRSEKRTGEKIGKVLINFLRPLLMGGFRKYRGIHAETVAQAMMILAAQHKQGKFIFESHDIQRLTEGKDGASKAVPTI